MNLKLPTKYERMNDTQEKVGTPPVGVHRLVRGRYRVHVWLNTKTGEPVYGIQRQKEPRGWVNCAVDGTALLYSVKETADRICRWLNDPQGTAPEWSQDAAL